jgi:hypothetical protein
MARFSAGGFDLVSLLVLPRSLRFRALFYTSGAGMLTASWRALLMVA